MSTPLPPLREFLLKTKLGRMVLLTSFLSLLCFLVPYGCSKKAKLEASSSGESQSQKANTNAKEGDLPPSPSGIGDTITLGQKYDALITRYGGDLASTKTELDTTRKELDILRSALKDERSAQDKEKKQLGDYLRQIKEGLSRETGQPAKQEPAPVDGNAVPADRSSAPGSSRGLHSILLTPSTSKERKWPERSVRIPAGSGGRATLMNGVFAPVTGEPSPVRLRFDAAVLGPNKARIPLRDSFLIGKAIGDPNSCRVSVQIEKFSTVKENGEVIETKALGYVVGEDGLEGVPGNYQWRALELAPLAITAGALQGGSDALAQSQTTTSMSPLGGAANFVTGDALKFSGFRAASGASGKMGEIITERMKEIRPAVSTTANRKVTVVFLDGVTLEGLDIQEIDYAKQDDPFRGLDTHR